MQTPFVFFGTPYVASDTLEILAANGYIPKLIVTNPDAPQGRGHVVAPSPTKAWALAHNVPVITPEKLTPEVIAKIAAEACPFAICVAYGKIIPEALISAFPKGIFNIHYSLLPKYRGAAPVEAALLHGDSVTGVTIQRMVYELDAGDIVAVRETDIGPEETTKDLRARLIPLGAELLVETLPSIIDDSATFTPQDHAAATHMGKIKKEDGLLDLSAPTLLNWNKYRAYAEWPGTYFFIEKNAKEMRVKIAKAALKDNAFVIERVIPEGKKEMDFEVFMR